MMEEYYDESINVHKYEMGNADAFRDDEYEDKAVAKAIMRLKGVNEYDIDIEADEFLLQLYRTGGLLQRLKKALDFDLESFDKMNIQYKKERCKIIYFFYILEHEYFPRTNIMKLLKNPSMENIDNSLLDMYTYNGPIIQKIKEELGKELPFYKAKKIKITVAQIISAWNVILENANMLMDFFCENGYHYNFEDTIHVISAETENGEIQSDSQSTHSPIEALYLKIVQHEYIGNIKDIMRLNDIQKEYDYNVPLEFVAEMKKLYYNTIDYDSIEQYIDENAFRLSKFVYLKYDVSKEEVRRIRNFKGKIVKWLSFCTRAKPELNLNEICNELQVVSFLQALILDDSNERFDYAFHGWENNMKHITRVQAALKNDSQVLDALQCYWVRKVTDHWYANIGRYDMRIEMRNFENVCDNICLKILSKSDLEQMQMIHNFYMERVEDGLITTREQIGAVQKLVGYLDDLGFKYVDYWYKIRYVFMYPQDIKSTLEQLISIIDEAIKNYLHSKSIKIATSNASGTDSIVVKFKLYFDYLGGECRLEEFEFIPI